MGLKHRGCGPACLTLQKRSGVLSVHRPQALPWAGEGDSYLGTLPLSQVPQRQGYG